MTETDLSDVLPRISVVARTQPRAPVVSLRTRTAPAGRAQEDAFPSAPIGHGTPDSSYAERMDFGLVVVFSGILIGGVALGLLLGVLRPRDEEAAATHRRLARRAFGWLPQRSRSKQVQV